MTYEIGIFWDIEIFGIFLGFCGILGFLRKSWDFCLGIIRISFGFLSFCGFFTEFLDFFWIFKTSFDKVQATRMKGLGRIY